MRRAATPVTQDQVNERKANAWFEWDYLGDSDDEHPFEWKRSDWGVLNDKLVAVDYAATAAGKSPAGSWKELLIKTSDL
jgi:hypothetical protein